MNRRSSKFWGYLLLSLSLLATNSHVLAEDQKTVVVQNHDAPPGAGWDEGELKLNYQSNKQVYDTLSLKFSGERNAKIDQFLISTNKWSLILSNEFRDIENPFPNRVVVKLLSSGSSDEIGFISISVPFRPDPDECKILLLVIDHGNIKSNTNYPVEMERCSQ